MQASGNEQGCQKRVTVYRFYTVVCLHVINMRCVEVLRTSARFGLRSNPKRCHRISHLATALQPVALQKLSSLITPAACSLRAVSLRTQRFSIRLSRSVLVELQICMCFFISRLPSDSTTSVLIDRHLSGVSMAGHEFPGDGHDDL